MGMRIVWEQRSESARLRPGLSSSGSRWLTRWLLQKRAEPEADASTAIPRAVVGIKKSAVYRDRGGQFRVIEFFLPADLLTKLRRPIEFQFMEGEELVTAEQLGEAIGSRFLNRASTLPNNPDSHSAK